MISQISVAKVKMNLSQLKMASASEITLSLILKGSIV
jgi:hypothetical protein